MLDLYPITSFMYLVDVKVGLIGDIDQAQALAIDPTENRLEQATELIGESALTRLGHLP
jgi:hypothetical protein